jgi:hypothetical protein
MSCGVAHPMKSGQAMVDQRPVYDRKWKGRRENQVIGKSGIIRRDKRKKNKYF